MYIKLTQGRHLTEGKTNVYVSLVRGVLRHLVGGGEGLSAPLSLMQYSVISQILKKITLESPSVP